MHIKQAGFAFNVDNPASAADWLATHFGFTINIDLGWYINTAHADQPELSVDFLRRGHESTFEGIRDEPVQGALIAFLVDDVDAEERRLRAAGADVVVELVSEPWGQRRFMVRSPDGLCVEVLQAVEPDPEWLAAHAG